MQFVLLIYQGTTPLPNTDAWSALPKDEQRAIYADYAALNDTPGLSAGLPLGLPEDAKTVRVEDGRAVASAARSSAQTARSVAMPSSRPMTSRPRSILRRGSPRRGTAARWRCALSARTGDRGAAEAFRSGAAPSDLA